MRLNQFEQLAIAIEKHHVDPMFAFVAHHARIKKAWIVYQPLVTDQRETAKNALIAANVAPPDAVRRAAEIWDAFQRTAEHFERIAVAEGKSARRDICLALFPAPSRVQRFLDQARAGIEAP